MKRVPPPAVLFPSLPPAFSTRRPREHQCRPNLGSNARTPWQICTPPASGTAQQLGSCQPPVCPGVRRIRLPHGQRG
eukprot:9292380-Pyramimonas_sp.AAC.1